MQVETLVGWQHIQSFESNPPYTVYIVGVGLNIKHWETTNGNLMVAKLFTGIHKNNNGNQIVMVQ